MSDHDGDPIDDDLAKSLFDAAKQETASGDARARARTKLGLDGGGGGGAGGGGGGGAIKIVGIAGLVVVGVGVWLATRSLDPPPPPPTPPTPPTPAVQITTVTEQQTEPAPIASPSTSPSTSAFAPTRIIRTTPSASASTAVVADTLALEIAALDRARSKLRSGDAPGALSDLDAYAKDHPKGALATEATLLRIEALVASNKKDEARRIATPLLERHDMTGDRARKLLDR